MRKQYTDEQIRQSINKHSNGNPNDVFYVVCQEILGYTPLGGFIFDMSEFDEFERRYKQVVAGKASSGPADSIDNGGQNEVDIYSQLVALVRAGKPIYVNGQLNEQQTTLHMSVIRRLREETGMSVQVVYN
ncbi:hypothetical protein ACFOY5_20985 [Massilia aurea]|uniref:hypothetical protein n=1 Tax=Massilia aurea TaxID=373040 RepID=UPI002162043B|nr:hypothetical protein [Massilia aurea]MCS0709978.1 hypothetical protein [Massilia aurea]